MPHAALLTPIGPVSVFERDGAIVAVDSGYAEGSAGSAPTELLQRALDQLDAYFAGRLQRFNLPFAPGGTPMHQRIWEHLHGIDYGCVTSYGALGYLVGTSPRVVAQACARNPLPIFVPCHRVLPATGRLGGYSFSDGAATKRALLVLEGAMSEDRAPTSVVAPRAAPRATS